ncbi:ABC transporter [Mesorhizobium microcysteis]|uniref:ABC transporter n=1 Tax=Neoaquamicrobium microcysteis TaxID=2682781 RepID=A0A5D4H2L7_9HYPH|nr:ABC-type transport auxiliary lipoprotein family protein [Mesorhizobium microcysteis]TYR33735.1 ABC transporter [Mesorhizobium microcysteis]
MIGRSLRACALVALLAVSGCAALPGGGPAPLDTYDLTAGTAVDPTEPRRGRTQVLVAEPTALKVLDGENVVIRPAAGSVEFLKGAQWADRLPRIVQARMVEALQSTGRLGGVGKPGEGLAIDYQIVTEVRSFEIRLDGPARAEVRLYVKVLNDRNGVVRASRSFAASAPVGGSGNDAYVAALDRALAQVLNELVPWSLGTM